MLSNPNTLGLFDPNILEITRIVHEAGGLCYYDGANLNAVMGHVRPGDMGFDCVHLNLHKTFSTPHGGAAPVGCKEFLAKFLPGPLVRGGQAGYEFFEPAASIGQVRSFYGNFTVVVRALAYILTLGKEGIPEASANAVLNANYLLKRLCDIYSVPYGERCMHEFVMDIGPLKHACGASAMDVAKRMLDFGVHPPTMHFPLIVHEALMVEPTETESPETLGGLVDKVHVLEAAERILPPLDKDIAQRVAMLGKKQGMDIAAGVRILGIAGNPGAVTVTYLDKKGAEQALVVDGVLAATGRRSNLAGLFADGFGCEPQVERGVMADSTGATGVDHLWVIGDAQAGNIQLAHMAAAQARNVVAAGIAVRCAKAVTGANGKCLIEDAPSGFIKLATCANDGVILGAQLVYPRATDMIAELALAVELRLTAAQLARVIRPHLTFCEAIADLARDLTR